MDIISLPNIEATHIITCDQLQEFLAYFQTVHNGEYNKSILSDIDFINEDQIEYYTSETQNWHLISSNEFAFDDETKTFYINAHITGYDKQIKAFSDWVSRSYENEEYPWESNAWDEGICTGDDDVDYNSSYLDIIVDAIELYIEHNKS